VTRRGAPQAAHTERKKNRMEEKILERGTTLVRRMILELGEATPWHIDPYHRVTAVVRGKALAIEFRDRGSPVRVEVMPGMSDWDEPSDSVHRAVMLGALRMKR
jgi:hypothetical protein